MAGQLLQRIPRFEKCYQIRVRQRIMQAINEPGASGTRMIDGDPLDYTVEVTIDLEAIVVSLGARAVRSKGGKSRDGFVTVKRVGRGRKPE